MINKNAILDLTMENNGITLQLNYLEMIRKYEVVGPIDLILKYKDAPDEIPKLSVDEYLKLNDPLQQNLYELIPKQNALQHKLNFIAHLHGWANSLIFVYSLMSMH